MSPEQLLLVAKANVVDMLKCEKKKQLLMGTAKNEGVIEGEKIPGEPDIIVIDDSGAEDTVDGEEEKEKDAVDGEKEKEKVLELQTDEGVGPLVHTASE